jgi:hypothetical protein
MKAKFSSLLVSILALTAALDGALAQGTAFTYQGRLSDTNGPANGVYDLLFTVWGVPSGGGTSLGPAVITNGVPVTNGLFTVTVDFGPDIFTGAERWIEIGVSTNGTGGFRTLSPRQPITASPYAITAGNLASGNYSGAVTFSNSANNFSGTFTGNGTALGNLSANNVTSGTLGDNRLSANVALLDRAQTFTGANSFISAAGLRIDVPGSSPRNAIHVGTNGFFGQAVTFLPNAGRGLEGLFLESFIGGESGGIFLNGDTLVMWSPGDNDILRVYDEDLFPTGAPVFRIDGSGNTFARAEMHIGGTEAAGLSLQNRETTDYVGGPVNGERWVWYVSQGACRLWSGTDKININTNGNLSFGAQTRQMLNLFNSAYGIGVQGFTLYQRSDNSFAWFRGGVHSDTANDPGAGGTRLMTLDANGELRIGGGVFAGLNLQNRNNPAQSWVLYSRNESDGSGRFAIWSGGDKLTLDTSGNLRTAGAVNPPSDRNVKRDFEDIDARGILEKLIQIPIQSWQYTNDSHARHLGPVAQDFHGAFGLGSDDKHIATVDADGVALAAIQGLNQKMEEQVKHKDAEIQELKARLTKLEQLLNR